MAKIAEAIRNSPLMTRKGGYSPIARQSQDPFVQGIAFEVQFIDSIIVHDRVGTDRVHNSVSRALDEAQSSKKSLRKATLIVKAVSITVEDLNKKSESVYPIYLVSYCGNARDADVIFFFIHKSKDTGEVRAEIFRCSTKDKVVAITRTLSKAFSIAFKAWQSKKRQNERKESPLLTRKSVMDKDTSDLGKTAVTKAAGDVHQGFSTPPMPHKEISTDLDGRVRSGSLDKDEHEMVGAMLNKRNPMLDRVQVKNEISGILLIYHAHPLCYAMELFTSIKIFIECCELH